MSIMKKPLNMLQQPMYPNYKKAPPRWRNAGKHWMVDEGKLLSETAEMPIVTEYAILAQSRDYNQTVYGKSSHKSVVNENFRPPIVDTYLDEKPLNRVPVKINAIYPRINPGAAGVFEAQNNQVIPNINKYLSDQIKKGDMSHYPNMSIPFEIPIDNSILPDLEMKMPRVCTHAGYQSRFTKEPTIQNITLDHMKYSTPMTPGHQAPHMHAVKSDFENIHLERQRGGGYVEAGFNTNFTAPIVDPEYQLEKKFGLTEVSAGFESSYKPMITNINSEIELVDKLQDKLEYSAGFNAPYMKDGPYNPNYEFENKPDAPFVVLNPSNGYQADNSDRQAQMMKRTSQKKYIGYDIQPEMPHKNTHPTQHIPKAKFKKEAMSQYIGTIDDCYIPRMHITQQPVKLKNTKVKY